MKLTEYFGKMDVYANVHIVHGHKGTIFVRAFYYMFGKMTPLNVIIAIHERHRNENM